MNLLKKYFCIIPSDMFLWLMIFIALFVFFDSFVLHISFFILMLGYILGNIVISARRHGFYRYIAFWSPFLQRKRVYVFMSDNWFFKPWVGKTRKRNPSKQDLFKWDIIQIINHAKKDAVYSCYTHSEVLEIIRKHAMADIFTKAAYKSTLSNVNKMIVVKNNIKEIPFFYTEVKIK